jgi:hypothetical protein
MVGELRPAKCEGALKRIAVTLASDGNSALTGHVPAGSVGKPRPAGKCLLLVLLVVATRENSVCQSAP